MTAPWSVVDSASLATGAGGIHMIERTSKPYFFERWAKGFRNYFIMLVFVNLFCFTIGYTSATVCLIEGSIGIVGACSAQYNVWKNEDYYATQN